MNVTCAQCKTVFRVDPRKVPATGVRARCSVCGGVFEVVQEDKPVAAPAAGAPPQAKAPLAVGMPPRAAPIATPSAIPSLGEPAAGEDEVETAEAPLTPSRAAPTPPKPQEPISGAPDPATAPTVQTPSGSPPPGAAPKAAKRPPFGEADQESRARRLARALISDVAAYHPERQERGLREGRLKELFQDELRKSWQEYVEHVGLETAKNTPFFRDALNEILAKGKRVF